MTTSPTAPASGISGEGLWLPAHRQLAELEVPLMVTRSPESTQPTRTIELAPLPNAWATRPTEATDSTWPARVAAAGGAWAVMGARRAVGGGPAGADCLDVDLQKSGSLEALHELADWAGGLPRPQLVQSTPSGGMHLIGRALDVRKVIDLVPGVDYQAGTVDGSGGRGGIWIAPTTGVMKGSLELVPYVWRSPSWAAEMLDVSWSEDPDRSRALLAERIRTWQPRRRTVQTSGWTPPPAPAAPLANGHQPARGGSGSRRPADLLADGRIPPMVAEIRESTEGSRNHTLNRCAMTVFAVLYGHRADGAPEGEVDMSVARAWDLLEAAGREVGLGGREIAATLRSAEAGGRRNPAAPKDAVTAAPSSIPTAEELALGATSGLPPGMPPLPPLPGAPQQPAARRAVVRAASSRRVRKASWAWRNRLPVGAISLLAGKPARGKSTLAEGELAARVSRGELDGDWRGRPRGVLITATEDAWEQTIQAKLVTHGADLDRVFEMGVEVVEEGERPPTLPIDVELLREVVREHDIGMVILDPLVSRLAASLDANKGKEVRQALEPLARLAAEEGIVVLGVIHPRKAGGDAMASIAGSSAFTEVVRSVLTVIDDPQDPGRRLLGVGKSSYGPVSDGSEHGAPLLAFTVEPARVAAELDEAVGGGQGETEVGKIAWQGEVEGSLAEAMDDARTVDSEERPARADAAQWLRAALQESEGQAAPKILKARHAAEYEAGVVPFSWRSVRRAADLIVTTERLENGEDGRPRYAWVLPELGAKGLGLFDD